MWSIALLGIAIAGLASLFMCKSLEISRNLRTPLGALREKADPLMERGWRWSSLKCQNLYANVVNVSSAWITEATREVESAFNKTLHAIATWIHRYLRGRRVLLPIRDEDVSAHLKNVLEYKKEARPHTEAEVNAESVKE